MKVNRRLLRWAIPTVIIALLLQSGLSGHDIPDEVVIQAFVKPEADRLHVVMRYPLITLGDIDLPKDGPGYLALAYIDPALRTAAGVIGEGVALLENDVRLTRFELRQTQISLPSDKSFATYEEALAHLGGPGLPVSTQVFWNQGFFDLHLEYPIQSDRSEFSIRMVMARALASRTVTVIRFMPPGGPVRAYELIDDPGIVRLDPRWHQAAWVFVKGGFFHILDGIDHLLFLLCLVIPVRRFGTLIAIVTSFTVAHSITLIASAYGAVPVGNWFPPLIETLIALSIIYMAIENALGANLRRRWLITFGFGLVHGFGFSFALRETLQFAGSHLLASLLAFNVGVELGQMLVLAIAVPGLGLLFHYVVAERAGTLILSVLVGHTAWHWMIERAANLQRVDWFALDVVVALKLVRGALVVVIAGGIIWLVATQLRRRPTVRHVPAAERD